MPGFGSGPFGYGAFGEWPWSLVTIVDGIPNVYREQDDLIADGVLRALLEGVTYSMDGLRRKIRDYDQLRDPLRTPIDQSFSILETILKTENLGDGTSRVFMSEGADGDKFKGIRVGMTLTDFRGYRFTICEVHQSSLSSEFSDPPIDPATGVATGRNIVVANIGQASTEFIPFSSGTYTFEENPLVGAFILSQDDDGIRLAPYVFNVEGSYIDGLAIADNRVTVSWTEGGTQKTGSFTNGGRPGGDLADTSAIDLTLAGVATGQITMYNDSGSAVDADSIRVTYTRVDDPPPEDAEVNAQNILAFLAGDVGIRLDRNDPEVLQRSYVNSAHKIWDIKGTELGYEVLGDYAGYFVSASSLYNISESISLGLPPDSIFSFPSGTFASGSIVAILASGLIDGETFTIDDGVNSAITFEFDRVPDGVAPGNIVVDISAAVTDVDVASAMVSAINTAAPLLLLASNDGGTSQIVTIGNTIPGEVGNVTTWSETVSGAGFVITQPVGGTNGVIFTTVDPRRPQFDEVALDVIPLDLLCSDAAFPDTAQAITVISATVISLEGSSKRVKVIATAADMSVSFGTEGVFEDASSKLFDVENFERIDSSTYSFETANFIVPSIGAGTVTWKSLKFVAPNTVTITGIGTDVEDLGRQSVGYSGHRYRITKTFTDPPIGDSANWAFIDSDGVVSYLESFSNVAGTTYEFEIIAANPPSSGAANIFLKCEIVTSCDFCRSSSLLIRISPEAILNYPESLEGDSLGRLIVRLQQMIPGHVRIAAFVYNPGASIAAWSISASSMSSEYAADDALYSAFFDEDEFPADVIPIDSAPIVASSEVTITNENVLEEYIAGSDPLIAGTWTASGLWHVTEYRSSTQFRSFNYGQNDIGRLGDVGAVAPDYDGVPAATISRLVSPSFSLLAIDSAVVIRFRHYGDVDGTVGEDLVRVEVIRDTGAVLTHTITKTMLGLVFGTNGSITTYSEDIASLILADDTYHLEFVFDTGASPSGAGTGEGWYVDDIEVQVTP